MGPRGGVGRPRLARVAGVAVLLAVLLAPAASGAGSAPAAAPTPEHALPRPLLLPTLPRDARAAPLAAVPRPEQPMNDEFYTQIGSSLVELNGTAALTEVGSLSEEIPLVNDPYPVGYELNLLSSTGDWYQILVGDNWPGCNSGLEELSEVWGVDDNPGPVDCDPTVTLSAGDLVRLNGSLPTDKLACLGLDDLTTRHAHVVCGDQPDPGATEFVTTTGPSNGDGYYTGTMTEIVNTSATSCPDYQHMPTVTFDFPAWANVSEFVGWSDEWNNVQGGQTCYDSTSPPTIDLAPTDPTSHTFDATEGASDGPQYVEGQNDSFWNASIGFRFQTNPVLITGVVLTASSTVVLPGNTTTLSVATSGGVSPFGTGWSLDGSLLSGASGTTYRYTAGAAGNFTFVAYARDAQGDVVASNSLVIRVPFPLSAGPLSVRPGPGIDVGETVNLSVTVSGGDPPLAFSWSGLPVGCAGGDAPWVLCTPTGAGATVVGVLLTQANGSTDAPPSLSLTVSPRLTVTLDAPRDVADLGQSMALTALIAGGAGGDSVAWSGLPTGCTPVGPRVACTFTAVGPALVSVSVTDANAERVSSPGLDLAVDPDLSVGLTASRGVVDVGASVVLAAGTVGGAGSLRYDWSDLPTGCAAANAPSLACTPTASGTVAVNVTVTDLANATVNATPLALQVVPRITVLLAANRTSAPAPGSFAVTPTVTGGTEVESTTWTGLPAGCHAGGLSPASCVGLPVGTYDVGLVVGDQGGGNASASIALTVTGPSPPAVPSPPLSVSPLELLLGVGAVGAVVALLLGRGRSGSGSATAGTPASDGWDRPITDADDAEDPDWR